MLAAMVRRSMPGAIEVTNFHSKDEIANLEATVTQAKSESDVLVVAGGVSVGDRDLVKEVLGRLGIETDFWRVRLKPGKPFLFGSGDDGTMVFGLPGNPVSAFVTFEVFVAPALRAWVGARGEDVLPRAVAAELGEDVANRGDRPHYLRGILSAGSGRFFPTGTQLSHALGALARADGLLRLGAGQKLQAGSKVSVFPVA